MVVLGAVLLATALRVQAGPPFLTDDPEPVDYLHGEAYLFATLDRTPGGKAGLYPAFEFNFGAAPHLQLHVVVPWAFSSPEGGPRTAGFGDLSAGLKFRFVQETDRRPQVGVFPMVSFPTGSAGRGLGNGAATVFLPVWVQKSWGPWTTYGGGGYTFNRAKGGLDFASGGWLLQRDLSPRLTLGGEVFAQGRSAPDAPGTTLVNVGGQVQFGGGFSLLFSVGHSVTGADHRIAYLGLYYTWGPRAGPAPR